MKSWHMLVCAALVIAGAVLVAVGASAAAVVPVTACAVMMGAMVWMMMRPRGPGGG
jgi:hypothetical protein